MSLLKINKRREVRYAGLGYTGVLFVATTCNNTLYLSLLYIELLYVRKKRKL